MSVNIGDVYPPSEDTYLLVDTLLPLVPPYPIIVLEIGTGSGYLPNVLRQGGHCHSSTLMMATDINMACIQSVESSLGGTEVILMDLMSGLGRSLFDIVVFNPPYVPTDSQELKLAQGRRNISASWAGGEFGREIMIRAIKEVEVGRK